MLFSSIYNLNISQNLYIIRLQVGGLSMSSQKKSAKLHIIFKNFYFQITLQILDQVSEFKVFNKTQTSKPNLNPNYLKFKR